jgi:3-hydroxy-3-methylglutaryl CoA synthase
MESAMVGIVSFGTCIPCYRLPRETIAREWGVASLGGERAVAGHDEDSLTLAVNASVDSLAGKDPKGLDGVFFASTTPPYREKQASATVAAVLDTRADVRTADFTDTLRAGTSSLLAAADLVAGAGGSFLVCAGDCRMGEPDSAQEQNYGDAGAALVVGSEGVIAELVGSYTVSKEFLGTWRTEDQPYLRSFGGAFETKFGYARFVSAAVQGVLEKCGLSAGEIAHAAIAAPSQRVAQSTARALGLEPKSQLQDTFWTTVGDTGAAQPLLLLAAILERAAPGELVLVVGYGDGADAAVFRATSAVADEPRARRSVYSQIEVKRTLPSYGRYARFRKLLRKDYSSTDTSTPVVLFRDQREILSLYGGKCPRCATVQFPMHRICVECGHAGGLEEVRLGRRGKVFTFTHDYLAESPDPPVTHTVVDLEEGGRLYVQMTDCDPDRVQIDMPVELTFRKYHEGFGLKNYFWKARPA